MEPTDFVAVRTALHAIPEHLPDIGGICSRLEIAPVPARIGSARARVTCRVDPWPKSRACTGRLGAVARGFFRPGRWGSWCPPASGRDMPFSEAPEEGTGQEHRHGALQPRPAPGQPEAAEGGQAAGDQGADRRRAPDDAARRRADSPHRLGGSQPLAEGDGHDRPRHRRRNRPGRRPEPPVASPARPP